MAVWAVLVSLSKCYLVNNKKESFSAVVGLLRTPFRILLDRSDGKITIDDLQFVNHAGAGVGKSQSLRLVDIRLGVCVILNAHPCARVIQNCGVGVVGTESLESGDFLCGKGSFDGCRENVRNRRAIVSSL